MYALQGVIALWLVDVAEVKVDAEVKGKAVAA